MTDVLEHTITITIPDKFWELAKAGLRMLRQLHRAAGGTSKMVKKADRIALTVKGPAQAVLDAVENTRKIERLIHEGAQKKKKEDTYLNAVDRLQDTVKKHQRNNMAQILEAFDEVMKKDRR